MSKPETIKINDVEYVRKDSVQPTNGDIRIVVLQRGWVVVGRFTQDGSQCKLENANVIRSWGTTKGLGEIAEGGPTSKTILDPCPTIRYHEMTAILTIDCKENKWNNRLS